MDVLMSETEVFRFSIAVLFSSDVGSIGSDIGRVLIQFFIGFEQLRSVNGVGGTSFRQLPAATLVILFNVLLPWLAENELVVSFQLRLSERKIGDGRINIHDERCFDPTLRLVSIQPGSRSPFGTVFQKGHRRRH